MRILIFNWRDWQHPWAGGAEIYTHEVAEEWVRQGHQVTLFCAGHPTLPDLDIAEGVAIVRRGNRFTVYNEARKFYRREAKGKFDLVIDEVNTRPFLCPSFVSDVPVVALIHQVAREVWFNEFPLPFAALGRYVMEPKWLRRYRNVATVTVSESSRISLEMYGLQNVCVVPEGLPPFEETPTELKEEVPTVVFCGRMANNKRPEAVLQAFRIVLGELPDAQLWMVGAGRELSRLQRKYNDPRISFKGRVSHEEKFKFMSRAHALASTSVREGWGLVVSEAASVGTIAFGYNVPGLCDSVKASNGILVDPSPEALAESMVENLPLLVKGAGPSPVVGGLAPWSEVARGILDAAGAESPAPIVVA